MAPADRPRAPGPRAPPRSAPAGAGAPPGPARRPGEGRGMENRWRRGLDGHSVLLGLVHLLPQALFIPELALRVEDPHLLGPAALASQNGLRFGFFPVLPKVGFRIGGFLQDLGEVCQASKAALLAHVMTELLWGLHSGPMLKPTPFGAGRQVEKTSGYTLALRAACRVPRAIISSSLVGITATAQLESGVEMYRAALLRLSLISRSSLTPR